jgi:hypothetical protein
VPGLEVSCWRYYSVIITAWPGESWSLVGLWQKGVEDSGLDVAVVASSVSKIFWSNKIDNFGEGGM